MIHFVRLPLFLTLLQEPSPSIHERLFLESTFPQAEAALVLHLKSSPDDAEARMALGVAQCFDAFQCLAQSLYRMGFEEQLAWIRFLSPIPSLPIAKNPKPETATYGGVRAVLETFTRDLAEAEQTFAKVLDEAVKLRLHVGRMRCNLTTVADASVSLCELLESLGLLVPEANSDLLISFDHSDATWFRGYCHLLSALAEIALAHDSRELFHATAHLFFAKVQTPYPFLTHPGEGESRSDNYEIVDLIALVHHLHFPVAEPERMKSALSHFESTFALSRLFWQQAQAETDDDREWLPNSKQQSALGAKVPQEMVDTWLGMLGEAELVMKGEHLVPFWRGGGKQGVNLRKVFTEPQEFDLVRWIQGTGAAPFLEEGKMTKREVWERMQRVFGGEFLGFTLWFN